MIGQERRGENDGQVKSLIMTGGKEKAPPLFVLPTPFGGFRVKTKYISFLVALACFIAILNVQLVNGKEANRCLAILVFATIMWATEVCLFAI